MVGDKRHADLKLKSIIYKHTQILTRFKVLYGIHKHISWGTIIPMYHGNCNIHLPVNQHFFLITGFLQDYTSTNLRILFFNNWNKL